MRFFCLSIPNEMQNTIRELYYTERKGTYDPHGWDKLNLCLTDRYNAGVLDNPQNSLLLSTGRQVITSNSSTKRTEL